MQSKRVSSSSAAASSLEPTAVISTSSSLPISSTIDCRCVSSSSTTSSRLAPRSMKLASSANASSSRLLGDGLLEVRDRARAERVLAAVRARDDVHGDVPRARVALEALEQRPAVDDRQRHVEHDRVGPVLAGEREPAVAAERDEPLEAALARDPEQRAREVGVVLDDQDDPVAGVEPVAVVLDLARARAAPGRPRSPRARSSSSAQAPARRQPARRCPCPGAGRRPAAARAGTSCPRRTCCRRGSRRRAGA